MVLSHYDHFEESQCPSWLCPSEFALLQCFWLLELGDMNIFKDNTSRNIYDNITKYHDINLFNVYFMYRSIHWINKLL